MAEAVVAWPTEGFRRVPYRVYHDPAVFARERQKIFRGPVWNFLALEAELPDPGDFKTTSIADIPIVVTRDRDGSLHAFVNRCAHRGSRLCLKSSGKNLQDLTCVYHAWTYDLRGNLVSAAFRRGLRGEGGLPEDFELREHGLETLRVESFAGIVFGSFDPATEPLADYIGAVGPSIRRVMRKPLRVLGYDSMVINGNWKSYHENNKDTYHANILHAFFGTFGMSRQSQESRMILDAGGRHMYTYTKRGTEVDSEDYARTTANLRSVQSNFKLADPSLLDWIDEFGDGQSVSITTLFPNFVLHQIQNSLAVRQIIPRSAKQLEVIFTYFGYRDDPPEMTRMRLKQANGTGSAGLISMEDFAVCEFVDQGTTGSEDDDAAFLEMGGKELTSGGESKLSERALRNFWNVYRTLMDV